MLKLAAGLGLAATAPTSAERVSAMHSLDAVVSENPLLDPGTFATDTDAYIGDHNDAWWSAISPETWAAYQQAERAFEAMLPWMRDNEPVYRAYNELSAATLSFALESHRSGIRQGAAFENLRRLVVGETTGCRTCWSVGLTKTGETCSTCGGTGTVAMKP